MRLPFLVFFTIISVYISGERVLSFNEKERANSRPNIKEMKRKEGRENAKEREKMWTPLVLSDFGEIFSPIRHHNSSSKK